MKLELRKAMRVARDGLDPEVRQAHSLLISKYTRSLLDRLFEDAAVTVMSYVPFRSEVDMWPMMDELLRVGYRVAAPKVQQKQGEMRAYYIEGLVDLAPGAWGIMEPSDERKRLGDEERIDAVIVPGLAFDRGGGRLGYGAGYYDRFLRGYEERGWSPPVKIGVCYGMQLVDQIPMEAHDCRMDWVVTEDGVIEV